MILGLGTDLCAQSRIEQLVERFGERFLKRVFSAQEIIEAKAIVNYQRRIGRLTSNFAVKEAMSKALGTGIRRLGASGSGGVGSSGGGVLLPVFWQDIESGRFNSGKPFLRLSGNARVIAHRLAARVEGAIACVEISTSSEGGLTQAMVALYACARADMHEDLVCV